MASTNYISSIGKREDLSDIIAVVDSKETVLTSILRKGKKPANAYVEWQVDSYPSTSTAGVVDGTDAFTMTTTIASLSTATDVKATTTGYEDFASTRKRIGTYIQTFRRTPRVSRLEEMVANVAGLNNPDPQGVAGNTEFARAKAKATIQVKRDVEATLLSDNGCSIDNGTNAYKTRGFGKWLSSTADSVAAQDSSVLLTADASVAAGAAGTYQTYEYGVNSNQTMANFNEDCFRSLLQTRWSNTGRSGDLIGVVGSAVKNAISDFTRYQPTVSGKSSVRFYNTNVADKKVSTSVDIYSGDYGTIELFLSAFVPNVNRGYIIDPEYAELRTHTAPYFQQLPDLGGGPRGIVETILALVVTNPLAHAKIAGS